MKKGISLIVLVITIIIMIILAGAVILTLTNSNIIAQARWSNLATERSDLQDQLNLAIGAYMSAKEGATPTDLADLKTVATSYTEPTKAWFTVDATNWTIKYNGGETDAPITTLPEGAVAGDYPWFTAATPAGE